MNREYTVEEFNKIVYYLYENCNDITIATDIICGFPYETDENHKDTIKLINNHKFKVINISKY